MNQIQRYLDEAYQDLRSYLGQETLDAIAAYYAHVNSLAEGEPITLVPAEEQGSYALLLSRSQDYVIYRAMQEWIPSHVSSLHANGPTASDAEGQRGLYRYEYEDAKASTLRNAANALERMLDQVEQEPAIWTNWLQGPGAERMGVYVHSAALYKQLVVAGGATVYHHLLSYLHSLQVDYFPLLLTEEVNSYLLSAKKNNTLSAEDTELLKHLQYLEVHKALADGLRDLTLIVDEKGAYVLTDRQRDSHSGQVNEKLLAAKMQFHLDRAKQYEDSAKRILTKYASETLWPEWYAKSQVTVEGINMGDSGFIHF